MSRLARLLALALLVAPVAAAADVVSSTAVGDGASLAIEYDEQFRPLRRLSGLQRPTDVTALDDDSVLVVDLGARRVLLVDADGVLRWSVAIDGMPVRARPRPGGGYLVTLVDAVIALRADRSVEWRLAVANARAAVPLANGHILVASNDGQGWLTELTPAGEVIWRSKPLGYRGAAGSWVDEEPGRTFRSLWALDVAPDGTVFTADSDGVRLCLLAPDYTPRAIMPAPLSVSDTRLGPHAEMVFVSPEVGRVWVRSADGRERSFAPEHQPIVASLSPRGTLWVGLNVVPEAAVLNASAARAEPPPVVAWYQRALPLPLLAVALALFVVWLRRGEYPRGESQSPPAPRVTAAHRQLGAWRSAALAAGVAVLVASSYQAWREIAVVQLKLGMAERLWWFAACCLVAGVALRGLNALAGSAVTLSSFVPAEWRDPPRAGPSRSLAIATVVSLAGCIAVLRLWPEQQAIAMALWAMAQVWILAAAWPPAPAPRLERTAPLAVAAMAVVLLAAAGLRFWQIGYFPDFVHHDHGLLGREVLETLRGDWRSFFQRVHSVGRPALLPYLAALRLFGIEYWVLRLPAAVAGVAVVCGTYLLGRELFNGRTGLIAALLVAVNHVLVLYSRQPYVLDPVAPFLFSLYCAAVGLRRGSRWHGCLAGVLGGWALLAYYVSMTFVPIAATLLLYVAVRYPRRLWRSRAVLGWLVAGACVVYLPMLAAQSDISHRANSIVVFLHPDGSINWDPALWAHQLGRSFGAIVYWGTGSWGVITRSPVCIGVSACLFGVGLTYLLLSWRTPATCAVLATIALSIFLGSAVLPSPPSDYHFLSGIVAILLVAAVALDRGLALADGAPRPVRLLAQAATLGLLALVATTDLRSAWNAVSRPRASDGRTAFRAQADVMAARFIGAHPAYRHYLVRTRDELSAVSPILAFFGDDADVSDLSRELGGALPVEPVEPAAGASFIVLPGRAADRRAIEAMYPGAESNEVICDRGQTLWTYLVSAESVRAARHDVAAP